MRHGPHVAHSLHPVHDTAVVCTAPAAVQQRTLIKMNGWDPAGGETPYDGPHAPCTLQEICAALNNIVFALTRVYCPWDGFG